MIARPSGQADNRDIQDENNFIFICYNSYNLNYIRSILPIIKMLSFSAPFTFNVLLFTLSLRS